MFESERKRHLIDQAEIARLVAAIIKHGVSEHDIYEYAVRLFVIDLDILSDVIWSKYHSHVESTH
jgi:hypothetical protein